MIQMGKFTKSRRIVEALDQAIDTGALRPGDRLQAVRDIGRDFDASLSVVNNALNELERRGRIVRRRRSGVFVRTPEAAPNPWRNCVLLCVHPDGHIWGTFYAQLLRELNLRGWTAITVRHDMVLRHEPPPSLAAQLSELTRRELRGAIVMGGEYWKNPFLEGFPRNRTVFVFEQEQLGVCGHCVLVDYEATAYALTSHLIASGKRRIGIIIPVEVQLPERRRLQHFDQFCNGYERALREHGLSGSCRYLAELNTLNYRSLKANLATLLAEERCPDAIVSYMDSIAYQLCEAAAELGVRIPGELAVTGCYNTPWANHGGRTLTTVQYNTLSIAQQAVRLLEEAPEELQVTYINPEMRIGSSTCAELPASCHANQV